VFRGGHAQCFTNVGCIKIEKEKHTMTTQTTNNGLDPEVMRASIEAMRHDATQAMTFWNVATTWRGGTRSDTRVTHATVGDVHVNRDFTIKIDEPRELCGTDQYANPQEYLLAALNACMTVGYVASCALQGIELEELRIETEGNIDLRGFLGLDETVSPGYESLRYTVHIKGSGTPEEFQKIHESVMATSPNYHNLSRAVKLNDRLVVQA
jgi:uncharacterized OsmC-like protein